MESIALPFLDVSVMTIIVRISSIAMVFGGVVPYIPQYRDIKRNENAEGFSTYVCFALLIANTLRILFWFGHQYEITLLLQSITMNIAMLIMIHLCVRTRNKSQIIPSKEHCFTENREKDDNDVRTPNEESKPHPPSSKVIWDFDVNFFWKWTDFRSYLEFLALFTLCTGTFMYIFIDTYIIVELIGFLALLTEAMLGAPQFYRNLRKKSTRGMSKNMVLMWTVGDIFKTTYFVVREAPLQFWMCGSLQVTVDVAIILQTFIYRSIPSPPYLTKEAHRS